MIFFNESAISEDRHGEIIELAKSLTLNDVCQIINLFAPHIHTYNPSHPSSDRLLPINPACMNGFFIQVNVDSPEWIDECELCEAEENGEIQ
jgi:hypothetical protein